MTDQERFNHWAIVEVMGHRTFAGRVVEETIAGKGFLRIDVPATSTRPGWTKLLGLDSIYGITPTTEETARQMIGRLDSRPHDLFHCIDGQPSLGVNRYDDESPGF